MRQGDGDRLLGEEDADRFVFNDGFGNDIIADFQTSGRKEKIDLDGVSTIRSFRDLRFTMAHYSGVFPFQDYHFVYEDSKNGGEIDRGRRLEIEIR
ncbi:hypothetical protein [Hyphococcus sp.]|uniref:hypothetical protein n=1 Tax=Hyphococcus sp. TaxID=2038636 RepID=UPI0035C6CB0A